MYVCIHTQTHTQTHVFICIYIYQEYQLPPKTRPNASDDSDSAANA